MKEAMENGSQPEPQQTTQPEPPVAKPNGFRQLGDAENALINEVHTMAQIVGQFVNKVGTGTVATDNRWLGIAQADLQKGFMALVRSIARPDGF